MVVASQKQVQLILDIGIKQVNKKYEPGFKCENFVCNIYDEIGLPSNFSEQPFLLWDDIFEHKFVGNLCFLKNKKYVQQFYRFTHVGIILPKHYLLHYSRYFGEPNVRQVCITSFSDIFRIYNLSLPT